MRQLLAKLDRTLTERPAPAMCYMVSAAALLAAVCGAFLNFLLSEMMAVAGMLAVSLLFLALGWLQQDAKSAPSDAQPPQSPTRRRLEKTDSPQTEWSRLLAPKPGRMNGRPGGADEFDEAPSAALSE